MFLNNVLLISFYLEDESMIFIRKTGPDNAIIQGEEYQKDLSNIFPLYTHKCSKRSY